MVKRILKTPIVWIVFFIFSFMHGCVTQPDRIPVLMDGPYFSPNGGGEAAIIRHIKDAKNSLYIQAYSFTSDGIITAVIDAKKRGVDTVVVLDKSHMKEKGGAAERFKAAGIETLIDTRHAIAHNKLMLIDGHDTVTGSYNFTKSANERNAENVLMLDSVPVGALYRENFRKHQAHSVPFNGQMDMVAVSSLVED